MKVKVLAHPFRDAENGMVKRRPGEVFEVEDEKRGEKLVKDGWVEKVGPQARAKDRKPGEKARIEKELKTGTKTKELKTGEQKTK